MGTGIQQVNRKKQNSQAVLGNAKTAKEPIGNQRVREEPTTQAVEREQCGQLQNDAPGLGRNAPRRNRMRGQRLGCLRHFYLWRHEQVEDSAQQVERGVSEKDACVGSGAVSASQRWSKKGNPAASAPIAL